MPVYLVDFEATQAVTATEWNKRCKMDETPIQQASDFVANVGVPNLVPGFGPPATFVNLPVELILRIGDLLNPHDLVKLAILNKRLYETFSDNYFNRRFDLDFQFPSARLKAPKLIYGRV